MVELADAAVVAILTRAPSSGGKSRLFAALGRAPDPDLLAALLTDTVTASAVPGVIQVVFVEPAGACAEVRALLPGVEVAPQADGALGDRMAAAMRSLFDQGARAVALIGSDLPDLPPQAVARAFAALERDPQAVVLGPAADGGYYLVAATRVPPVFEGIDWGSAQVLAQTQAAAARCGLPVELLDVVADVDTPAELRRTAGPRTRAWVAAQKPWNG